MTDPTDRDREMATGFVIDVAIPRGVVPGSHTAHELRVTLTSLIGQARAEGRRAAFEEAARIWSEMAHEYECDWSSVEFNAASDMAKRLRDGISPCPRCSGTGRALAAKEQP